MLVFFQVKKSNKWNCKVCNEKQSVIKVGHSRETYLVFIDVG